VPEYVLAFFLLAMVGPGAWPAVLALAIHNAGILGRLGAEVVENLEAGPLRAMAGLGARRSILVAMGAFPLALGRFLLYVFYRFETCVREATVLGMLGILSLGYWIREARSRGEHDVMLFHVVLGGLLVLVADLASGLLRRRLRRP
jgi:phosphonate transport system permease protein